MIESDWLTTTDRFVPGAEEDMETDKDPSKLSGFPPGSDPNRILK